MRRRAMLVLVLSVAAGRAAAQERTRAVVVQVAGSTLYLDAGRERGLRPGDTVGVFRAPAGPPAGSLVVISATGTRSAVTFGTNPFPVTRGDTLYLDRRAPVTAVVPAAPVAQRPAPVARRPGPRVSGSLALDVAGSHSVTRGLGADPVTVTHDVATPSLRFRASAGRPGGTTALHLSFLAQHRAGPPGLFGPATSVHIYEAQLEQAAGPLRIRAGRSLSGFDHASGYWDGLLVSAGHGDGLSGGVAGGFEPERGNEGVSFDRPRVAGFLRYRTGNRVRWDGAVAVQYRLPRGGARTALADVSSRVDLGPLHLATELEAGRRVHRMQARAWLPAGRVLEVRGSYVRDYPGSPDAAPVAGVTARQRVSAGLGLRFPAVWLDADGSVNQPGQPDEGYTAALSLSAPGIGSPVRVTASGSYYSVPWGDGVFASPAVELHAAGFRVRSGYQLTVARGAAYTITTHGGDLLVSRRLSGQVEWMMRIFGRTGENLQSGGGTTSLTVRF